MRNAIFKYSILHIRKPGTDTEPFRLVGFDTRHGRGLATEKENYISVDHWGTCISGSTGPEKQSSTGCSEESIMYIGLSLPVSLNVSLLFNNLDDGNILHSKSIVPRA